MRNCLSCCARIVAGIVLAALLTACNGDIGDLKIKSWGPRAAVMGDVPNKQPDGAMGIWIVTSGPRKLKNVRVTFEGQTVPTILTDNGFTAAISPQQIASAGKKEVAIKHLVTGKIVPVGTFVVFAKAADDLKIEDWGPRLAMAGDIPNRLPDGKMGLWILAPGADALGKVEVLFDGRPVAPMISEKEITAAIAPEQLGKPGKKEIVIRQMKTGKIFSVGVLEVKAAK